MFRVVAFLAIVALAAASSHSEAPNTAARPQVDISDLYSFVSYEDGRENWVTTLMNVYPGQNAYAGPNYYSLSTNHFYEIAFDVDGDSVEDKIFSFYFGNELGSGNDGAAVTIEGRDITIPLKFAAPITADNTDGLNWFETYRVQYTAGDRDSDDRSPLETEDGNTKFVKPFDYAGEKTFGDAEAYEEYATSYVYSVVVPGCDDMGKIWVGQRADPFYINLGPIFDLVNFVPIDSTFEIAGLSFEGIGIEQDYANNALSQSNVHTIALELTKECLLGSDNDNTIVGTYGMIRKLEHDGDDHVPTTQKTRYGNPLVNELLIGLDQKGKFNRKIPSEDSRFRRFFKFPSMPVLLNALFLDAVNGIFADNDIDVVFDQLHPTFYPRMDIQDVFLSGVPGLNQISGKNSLRADLMRLNTAIPPVARGEQETLAVLSEDIAGFPNGRRPGDDVVDIALRVLMGALCVDPDSDGADSAYCTTDQAPTGSVPFTDGAPVADTDFGDAFPYFNTPYPGATN